MQNHPGMGIGRGGAIYPGQNPQNQQNNPFGSPSSTMEQGGFQSPQQPQNWGSGAEFGRGARGNVEQGGFQPPGGGGLGPQHIAALMQHPLVQHLVSSKGGPSSAAIPQMHSQADQLQQFTRSQGGPSQQAGPQPNPFGILQSPMAGPHGSGGKFGPGTGGVSPQMIQQLLHMFGGGGAGGRPGF